MTALAGNASAQTSSTSPLSAATVGAAFQSFGVSSEAGTDDYGDPFLQLTPGADLPADFGNVVFWDCDSAGICDSILMQVGWRPQRRPVRLDVINEWNVSNRWVRAYIDSENYIILDMDVNGYGGTSEDALSLQVARFLDAVEQFQQVLRR